jgi:hypothetical protein
VISWTGSSAGLLRNGTWPCPATTPSIAFRTVSMVCVLVKITDTAIASITRDAGPEKSAIPLTNAFTVAASPSRATTPTMIAMMTNRIVSSGSHQPSSREYGSTTWSR